MASTALSSLSRTTSSSLSQVRGAGAEMTPVKASATSSSARAAASSGKSGSQVAASGKTMINVDGQALNPNARRGTYLNIEV